MGHEEGGRLATGEWTGQGLECLAKEVDLEEDRALPKESRGFGSSPHSGRHP